MKSKSSFVRQAERSGQISVASRSKNDSPSTTRYSATLV